MERTLTSMGIKGDKTLWYRENSSDLVMWRENPYKKVNFKPDDIVMDIGGNIGDFPLRFSDKVATIHSYEPMLDTFEVLTKNVEGNGIKNCLTYNSAISHENGEISIFMNENAKMGHAAASTIPIRGRTEIKVPSVKFSDEVKRIKPTVIKMDIEGAEKMILDTTDDSVFDSCRIFIVETHLTFLKKGAEEWNKAIGQRFEKLFGSAQEHITWYFKKHHCSVWTFERL